jgi:hypothetical protein
MSSWFPNADTKGLKLGPLMRRIGLRYESKNR